MARCPLPNCPVTVANWYTLKTHLKGRKPQGHEVSEMDAEAIAKAVFDGTYRAPTQGLPEPGAVPTYDRALLTDPYAGFMIRLFETLVANKQLPKYQFERRVDAIITLFLPAILKQLRGWNVELVVPEFPLKKAENNQSTNADHLLFRHADSTGLTESWVFFELKTDSASCNDGQLDTYLSALDVGMPQLLKELELIAAASNARAKYAELRTRLAGFPVDRPLELVYLAPSRINVRHDRVLALTFQELALLSLPEFSQVWDLFRSIVLPALRG